MLFLASPINYVPLKFPSPCCVTSAPYAQLNCVLKENMANPEKRLVLLIIYMHINLKCTYIAYVFICKYKCI